VKLGATQRREARAGSGRIRGGANRRQQARSVAGQGPLGVVPWHGLPGQASLARLPAAAAPRRNRGGDRNERGEREGLVSKLNFLKILNRNMKNFDNKSCIEFENLQVLF
jgi:hypothetical protein